MPVKKHEAGAMAERSTHAGPKPNPMVVPLYRSALLGMLDTATHDGTMARRVCQCADGGMAGTPIRNSPHFLSVGPLMDCFGHKAQAPRRYCRACRKTLQVQCIRFIEIYRTEVWIFGRCALHVCCLGLDTIV